MDSSGTDMRPLAFVLSDLNEKGFSNDFQIQNAGFTCKLNDKEYKPEDLTIVKVYRFEGESSPDDMSVVYAIETCDGIKGTLIDAYGTYSDPKFAELIKRVKILEEER